MDYIETLFCALEEEALPKTPAYEENQKVRADLLSEIRQTMGREMEEKIIAAYAEWEWMESQRYFRYGIQLGLELLRL